MREREILKVTKFIGVNPFVYAFINMTCGLKKYVRMLKKNCVAMPYSEPTFRYKIISQKQCDTASEIFSMCLKFN